MGHSYEPDVQTYDAFQDRALWRLRFMWWPKRSHITGRWLWLRFAYQGLAVWGGPGDAVIEFRYHAPVEHIIWQLKQ